jgi:uncharacterized lipoprotein YmbA
MKIPALALVLALTVGGCAYKHQPVHTIDSALPPGVQHMSLAQIEATIRWTAGRLHWQVRHIAPGHLELTETEGTHSATVGVWFDQQHIRIDYVSSTNMVYQPGPPPTVHSHYNLWVDHLWSRLNSALADAASGRTPTE